MESKDPQLNRVVQCLGAAMLRCGVVEVRSRKLSMELGFERAWRQWPRAGRFPSISNDPGELFWIGIGKSGRRRGALVRWDRHQWSAPKVVNDGWTALDCLAVLVDERATSEDWDELATAFVATFDDADVRRE